jgi:hypothetical protein
MTKEIKNTNEVFRKAVLEAIGKGSSQKNLEMRLAILGYTGSSTLLEADRLSLEGKISKNDTNNGLVYTKVD